MSKPIIFSTLLIIPIVFITNSIIDESERYVLILEESDDFSNDVYLEFYEIESVKNRQVIVDEGIILLENDEFQIYDEWKGSFLNDDRLFFMAGKAENIESQIDIFVMGKFLEKTIEGSMYDVAVHIHSEQTIEFQSKGEIIGLVPKKITEKVEAEKSIELLFLIKDTHHRFQDQEYSFTTKLYDKKENPTKEWNVKGGEINSAEIIVKTMDLQGNTLHEINGITNKNGWFEGKFPIDVSTFPRGKYSVIYTAKIQNSTIEIIKPLYVFEVKTDANYRHFTPTSDIDDGFWKDDSGNGNNLLYDELDEYSRDDSDYVRSRGLTEKGGKIRDTFEVKLSTYAGVTTDHNHIIQYTLKKYSQPTSENVINFTVTLLEGTNQIAQWTHLNFEEIESFSEIKNILTEEEKNLISDYNDLRLRFTAQCEPCNVDNRKIEGQVSWVHMIV